MPTLKELLQQQQDYFKELERNPPKPKTPKQLNLPMPQQLQNQQNLLNNPLITKYAQSTKPNLPPPQKPSIAKGLGYKSLAGWAGLGAGVEQGINMLTPIKKTLPMTQAQRALSQRADNYLQGAGKGWQVAGSIAEGIGGAAPQAILALMSSGASTGAQSGSKLPVLANATTTGAKALTNAIQNSAQTLSKNPAFWTSFIRMAGPTYTEAKKEGASELQAQATAIINSFLGAGVEVGGGIETFKAGGGVKQWVKSMLEEGREEVVQGMIENLTKKAVYDKGRANVSLTDDDAIINPLRAGKEFGMGAAVGGILGGAQTGVSKGINALGNVNLPTKADIEKMNAQKRPILPPLIPKAQAQPILPPKLPTQADIQTLGGQPTRNIGTLPPMQKPILTPTQVETAQRNINLPPKQEVGVQAQNKPVIQGKAQQYQTKQENKFIDIVSDVLSVPKSANKEFLRPIAQKLSQEFLETDAISRESADSLFEEAYKNGIVVSEEHYNQYKPVRDEIRNTTLTISTRDSSGITDFKDFRSSNFGKLKIKTISPENNVFSEKQSKIDGALKQKENLGIPADVKYQELSERYPELFPVDIINPADQLQHISNVVNGITKTESDLNSYFGDNAAEFKEFSKMEFDKELENLKIELKNVKRYSEDKVKAPSNELNIDTLKENLKPLGNLRRVAEKAVKTNLLTSQDNAQVDRLVKGEITLDDIPKNKGYNIKGIKAVYEAKYPVYQLEKQLKDYNNMRKAEMRAEADKDIETLPEWKKPDGTMRMSVSTMERIIRRIVPTNAVAENLIKKYITPVHKQEAERTRFKNKYRNKVRELKLTQKESEAVQFLGEVNSEIEALQERQGKRKLLPKKGDRLLELIKSKNEFLSNNPNLDMIKVNNAIKNFRSIYNDLFEQMNEVRLKNGYTPVEYRKNYFPHFSDNAPDNIMGKLAQGLGISFDVQDLPTTISGLTHTFKPGITWFSSSQQRKGNTTIYDAVRGFDKYIEGVSDVIHHTDNIQRLRALTETIRYRYSDEGIQKRVDEIRESPNMSPEEKSSLIEDVYKEDKSGGSSFVQELEEYTNLLANKKSKRDRNAEADIGRKIYSVTKTLSNRVAANMVALNPASWLTNFIPLTQGGATLKNSSMIRATLDTLKSTINDDGFENKSTFLTNRKGSEPLAKTVEQKISSTLSSPMEMIDMTTANILTRAKYYDNMRNGMSEQQAIDDADSFSAKVMADRSKGSTPTRFQAKNPITKTYTMFQLEVANQLGYLFEDMPRDLKNEGIKALVMALFKYAVGAFIYNELYEKLIGRRPALDPIGLIKESYEDFTSDIPKTKAVGNLGKNIAEDIPFVGGFLGGGRFPVMSGIPDGGKLTSSLVGLTSGEQNAKKALSNLGKEISKPAAMIFPPFGGGQVRKVAQGLSAIKNQGSYSVDKDGDDILQYPAEGGVGNIAKSVLFGKTSTPQAQEWIKSGFKSLSAKETEEYKKMLDSGISAFEAFDKIQKAKQENSEKAKTNKDFNERFKTEIPVFKYQDRIDALQEKYKNEYNESISLGATKKSRDFKASGTVYSLTDDLLIERQKIYQSALERAYSTIINRPYTDREKVLRLKEAKNSVGNLVDLEFWGKYKDKIQQYEVKLPPKR